MSFPLVDFQLHRFGSRGHISPYNPDQVNPASYNLTIGTNAVIEVPPYGQQHLDLSEFSAVKPYYLKPGGWILVDVGEVVNIPSDHEAQVILRSSAARRGWDHALAGYVDPGYSGRLTLEFMNCLRYGNLAIYPGLELVQLRICRLSVAPRNDYSQTGRYQDAVTVETCKDSTLL